MKKGLSVLLIAAALFGFYGGAVSLNDVLACKDYWEEEGEKSTADMNRLEDGLNQLKDNEEAYLDGLEAVAEGEEKLADGEQAYADGQAQLAQGEADYAAAPGKLAAARKQLAEGEDALEDGQNSINGLTQLISGINQVLKGYNDSWRPGYEKLKDGRAQLYKGSKDSKEDLTSLAGFLPDTYKAPFVAAVNDVAGDDEEQSADDYKKFIQSTNVLVSALPQAQAAVKEKAGQAAQLLAALNSAAEVNNLQFAGTVNKQEDNLTAFAALITDEDDKEAFIGAVKKVSEAFTDIQNSITENVTDKVTETLTEKVAEYMKTDEAKEQIAEAMAQGASQEAAIETVTKAATEKMQPAITEEVTKEVTAAAIENADKNTALNAGKEGIIGGMTKISGTLDAANEKLNGENSDINKKLIPGLKLFNAQATTDAVDQLAEGQDTVAGGVQQIASAVMGNSTLKAGVKKAFGQSALALLNTYKSETNLLNTKISDFSRFEAQMDTNPGIVSFLNKAKALLASTKADGLKSLAAGKKKLAAGKAQYAEGLASYKAAPGKLADARQQLAEGLQTLMDGRADLAAGKEKLAEYEDGEQQVRDGLATLMATEAQGGLESILDRRNGDDDFDDPNGHLMIDEGLDAVSTGRGYQADSGELITKEITNRAIGTAAGLGAGALAVLAAILSFLKKNKGAGVSAILSAAAGAVGVGIGTSAGAEFSSIAGSTVGATPWIAAGILAAVALVHAIVHFSSKAA